MRIFLLVALVLVAQPSWAKSFSVMTYNLENFFDTEHDEGKKDWTYLPLAFKRKSKEVQAYCNSMRNRYYKKACKELDWNTQTLRAKIKNLASVIRQYNKGQGADVLVFQEAENINALNLLLKHELFKNGYKYATLIEGPDNRGIDIGMISKIKPSHVNYHEIDLTQIQQRGKTRGILEVTYEVKKKRITIFGNHWPSQANIDESRLLASAILKKVSKYKKSDLVIATGDFNTTHTDSPHGLNLNIKPDFIDVEVKGRRFSNVLAKGTHWYKGEWESLDKIFVRKQKNSNIQIRYNTFEIVYEPFMTHNVEWTDNETQQTQMDSGVPMRFDAKKHTGYSDHLPVAITFDI
jgi:endonuclease/exonuclease/phosphatase family metal-dependent hydrolase